MQWCEIQARESKRVNPSAGIQARKCKGGKRVKSKRGKMKGVKEGEMKAGKSKRGKMTAGERG